MWEGEQNVPLKKMKLGDLRGSQSAQLLASLSGTSSVDDEFETSGSQSSKEDAGDRSRDSKTWDKKRIPLDTPEWMPPVRFRLT